MKKLSLQFSPYLACLLIAACASDGPTLSDGGTDEPDENEPSTSSGGTNTQPNPSAGTGGAPAGMPIDVTPLGGSRPVGPFECNGPATGEEPLIDDLEDMNKIIPSNESRNGWWEAFDDESGEFGGKINFATGEGEGIDGSNARCVDINGFTGWGAVISVSMGFPRCMYDASAYAGVCFSARGTITQGDQIDFSVNTADTLGTEDGGRCDLTADDDSCERFWHYKVPMRATGSEAAEEGETLLAEGEYNEFCYTWDELQQDPETPTPFDKNVEEIVQFEWKWAGGYPTEEVDELGDPIMGSTDGELCVDNVRFMTFDEAPAMGGASGN